jgi:branched-chain amino acid transport system permease protein
MRPLFRLVAASGTGELFVATTLFVIVGTGVAAGLAGLSMALGAFVAGLISTSGLVSYALDKWLGLSGNWALLFGGVALIVTLILNPEGVAGANYKKAQQRKRRRQAQAPVPVPEATP